MAVDARLILDGALAVAIASLHVFVGTIVLGRRLDDRDSRLANRSFATWWMSLAAATLISGLRSLLVAAGQDDRVLHETLLHVYVLPLVVSLGSLLYYLVYVHTGRRAWLWPIAVGHAAVYVFFVGVLVHLDPVGVAADGWRVDTAFARGLGGPLLTVTLLVLALPALLAALAYFTLMFRTRDRTARYRIAMVSLPLAAWFGANLAGGLLQVGDRVAWWPLASRAIALSATLLVVAAFRPPRWLRTRLGLGSDPV